MVKQLIVIFCICPLKTHFASSQNRVTPFAVGFDVICDSIVDGKIDTISYLIDKDYNGNFTIAPYEPEFVEISN